MIKKIILLMLLVFLYSCTPSSTVPPEKQCTQNSDCVPSSCCHAKDALNKEYAPKCDGVFCTQECAAGTLDCGQGEITCVEKGCKVLFKD